MNKKVLNGVLIATLLAVWGWIMYTLFAPEESPEFDFQAATPAMRKAELDTAKERYVLKLDYPDPFLKGLKVKRKAVASSEQPVKAKPQVARKARVVVPPPDVAYKGMMKSAPREEERLIIAVSGKDKIIDPKDHDLDFRIVSYDADSLWIAREKERFAFGRK